MTKRILDSTIRFVISFYILTLILGAYLKLYVPNQNYYTLFKDLIPIIFAIPAAYLVFCFQRRNEYLKALRSVYSILIQVHIDFVDYTFDEVKSDEKYCRLRTSISKSIEEIRGVYKNVGEIFDYEEGVYPFEPLKEIYSTDLEELHNGNFSKEKNKSIRKKHYEKWKSIRVNFLNELERSEATFPVTKYISRKKFY